MAIKHDKQDDFWKIAGGILMLILIYMIGYNQATKKPEPVKNTLEISPTLKPSPAVVFNEGTEAFNVEHTLFFNMNRQWLYLNSRELGLSFQYPIPKGEVIFNLNDYGDEETDPTGQIYSWVIKVDDGTAEPPVYPLAGGISASYKAGREKLVTDFVELTENDYSEALQIFKTKYQADAVWKNLTETNEDETDSVLLVNLPNSKDPRFKGLAIYFREPVTPGDVQNVVESIKIE